MERTKYVLTSAILLSLLGLTTTGCDGGSSTTIVSTNQLVFSQQPPATAVAGQPLTPEVVVQAVDANGTVITTVTDPITITLVSSNGASLGGTATVNAVAGVARFSDLRVDRAGTNNALVATSAKQVPGYSAPFTVTPGNATQLRFVNAVNTGTPNVPLDPIQIELLDAGGNRATSSTQAVTMSIVASNGAILGGATIIGASNGVATFSSLTVDRAGSYQIIATASSISATSPTFTVSAAPSPFVGSLSYGTQPGNASEGGAIPSFTVELRDNFGALLTSASNPVTINLGTNPGGAALGGTLTVPAVNGIATFSSVIVDRAGSNYRLTASVGGFNDALSNTFNVTATTARSLTFVTGGQPGNVAEGASLGTVQVQILNSTGGNANAANPVTIQLGSNPGGATLSGTLTVIANASGLATFNNLTLDRAGAGYTLTATSGGLQTSTSNAFTISPSTARQLGFTTQPSNVGQGQPMSTVRVALQTSTGATVATPNVLVTLQLGANPTNAVLGGTLTVPTNAGGIAEFSDLTLSKPGTNLSFTATAGALTPASSGLFTVNATAADRLAFVGSITGVAAGSSLPTITVEVRNANNTAVIGAQDRVTLLIGTNAGGGTLRGIASATANPATGQATFTNLSIDRAGVDYRLVAISGALTAAESNQFTIGPTTALALRFFNPPGDVAAGSVINAPGGVTVEVVDANGARVTSATNQVTIALGSNPGPSTLSGTLSVNAVAGLATFKTLSLNTPAAGYTLAVTGTGLTGATSGTFDVQPATAARLGFVAGNQPQTIPENGTMSTDVLVEVQDSSGARVFGATNFVTLHLAANPGGSTLRGLTITAQAVNGRATFSGLSLDRAAAGYVLGASSPGLLGALSSSFDVTAVLATGARGVDFTSTPGSAAEGGTFTATVQLVNSVGAPVIGASNLVTLQLGSNPTGAVLSGPAFTVAANGAGLATFTGLSIDKIGTYTLLATSNGLTSDISAPIAITAGAARELRFNAFTGAPEASTLPTITVRITDTNGVTVTSATNLVTLAFANNPAAATLSGVTAVPAVGGVATFTGLSVNRASASNFSLVATSGALTPGISNDFAVSAATARSLAFTGPLPTGTAGNTLPSVTVLVRDANNNLATTASNLVTLELGTNTAGGILRGTLSVAAVNGVAQFNDLSLDRAGTYTLHATAGGLVDAQSGAFSVSGTPAGVSPVALSFTVQPTSTAEGSLINGGPPAGVSVAIVSSSGSTITGATNRVTVSLASNTGGGLLFGPTSVNAVNGVATFSNLAIDRAGSYTLLATANGLEGDVSASFTITPATARQLAFTVSPPASTLAGSAFSNTVTVAIQNASGGTVTNATNRVTLVIGRNIGGANLLGTVTVNAVNGLAQFPGLALDQAGAGYTLAAFSNGLEQAESSTFTITAPTVGAQLAFSVQPPALPTTTAEGSVLASFQVQVQTAGGAPVTSASNLISIALVNNTTGAILGGTLTQTAASGTATFNDVRLDRAGVYQLIATAHGVPPVVSGSFTISASTARTLTFSIPPLSGTEGGALLPSPVEVRILDSAGALANVNNEVTISIADNPAGGTLSGTTTVTASGGIATFNSLSLSKAGTYRLMASSPGLPSVIQSTPVGGFSVAPSTARGLAFSAGPPASTPAGAVLLPLQVQLQNSTPAPTAGTNPVTLQLASNPSGATLSGTLTVTPTAGGLANFTDVRIDKPGSGYTLLASAPGLNVALSSSFSITGSASDHLVVETQPGSGITEGTNFTVAVRVVDVAGNPITGSAIPVTLVLANNPGGAILRGQTNVNTDNAGLATFSQISLDRAGTGYTLLAVSGGLPTVVTSSFNVGATTARSMTFATQPSAVNEGQVVTPSVSIQVRDALNAPVGAGFNVTVVLGSNPGGAHLTGTLTVPTDPSGVATFSNLRLDRTGTGYRLLALSGGLPSIVSDPFNVTPFIARDVAFTSQPPTSVDEGATFNVDVRLRDGTGGFVSSPNVPVTIDLASNPGGGALAGTLTVLTNGSGVASFTGLKIDKAGAPFQLRASSAGLTDGLSNTFTVAPALARRLSFTANPVTTFAFTTMNQPGGVQVRVEDSNGDAVVGQSYLVTLVLSRNTPNGVVSGTLSQFSSPVTGIAAFTDLVLNLPANGYTFTAFASGLTPAVSTAFDILGTPPSAGTHLGLVQNDNPRNTPQAASITNIASNTALQVEILDVFNNRVAAASGAVTVQLGSNPANGILGGTLTVNAINGVATFPNLTLDKVGTGYRLTFTSANLVGVTTTPFDITPSLADHLTFVQPINPSTPQNVLLTDIAVSSTAIYVQVVTGAPANAPFAQAGIPVTLAITTNNGTPVHGALSGTTTRLTNAAGVAIFDDLSIDSIGVGYVLTATANGLGPVSSNAFSITRNNVAALSFVLGGGAAPTNTNELQPINAPTGVVVQALDDLGAPIGIAGIPVTLTIDTNGAGGVLSGTLTQTTSAGGLATFAGLSIDRAGTYRLRAASGGLTAATSATFDILPATAFLPVFGSIASAREGVAIAPAFAVEIHDALGQVVAGLNTGSVVLSFASNPNGATLSGNLTALIVNGVATFSNVSIDRFGTYTLVAASNGTHFGISGPVVITPARAAALVFEAEPNPTGNLQNVAFVATDSNSELRVRVVDNAGGWVLSGAGGLPVTLAITTNGSSTGTPGELHGTITRLTNAQGIATFSDLSIDTIGTGYRLTASSGSLGVATTAGFEILASAAVSLNFVNPDGQPAGANENQVIPGNTGNIRVEVRGQGGALLTLDNVPVTVTLDRNPNPASAVLRGTLTRRTVGGVATFDDLSIDQAGGSYGLRASSGSLVAGDSSLFTINSTTATNLALLFQPQSPVLENQALTDGAIPATRQLVVQLRDANNNPVTLSGVPVTAAISTNHSTSGVRPGELHGTTTRLTVNGEAIFDDLSIDTVGAGYRLVFTAGDLFSAASNTVTVQANSAAAVKFVTATPPLPVASVRENEVLASLSVQLHDLAGNPVDLTGVPVTVTLRDNPAGSVLRGSVTRLTAAGGVATFSDLALDRAGNGYRLRASSGDLTEDYSDTFNVIAATSSSVAFVTGFQPTTAGQNQSLGTIRVQLLDAAGQPSPEPNVLVTLVISSNGGSPLAGILSGTTTATTNGLGVAEFTGLSIQSVGTYQLTALCGRLQSAVSGQFNVTQLDIDRLRFSVEPTGGDERAPLTPTIVVQVANSLGDVTSGAGGIPVTLSFHSNTAAAVMSGTTTVTTQADGSATFTGVTIDKAGVGFVLRATAGSLTPATTSPFDVQPTQARSLAFQGAMDDVGQFALLRTGGPTAPVQVRLRDGNGQNVLLAGVAVTAAINTQATPLAGPWGSLGGSTTVITDSNGVATFNNLTIDRRGTGYSLLFTSGTLTATTSDDFDVNPTAAAALEFANLDIADADENATLEDAGGPAGVTVNVLNSAGVAITDNSVDGLLVTISFAANPAGGVLRGTVQRSVTNGQAVFNDLSINRGAAGYALQVTCGTLVGDTSNSFTIRAVNAVDLAWEGAPAGTSDTPATTSIGQTITAGSGGQLRVLLRNSAGVVVDDDTTQVTVVLGSNPTSGVLGGTLTRTALNGIATFDDLKISQAGVGYSLTAFAGPLTPDTTSTFTVTGPAATRLVFRTHPNATTTTSAAVGVGTSAGGPYDLSATLAPAPILPGTLAITIGGAGPTGIIRDDGAGRLYHATLLPNGGTVDYTTGAIGGTTASLNAGATINEVHQVEGSTPVLAGVNFAAPANQIRVEALTAAGELDTAFVASAVVLQLGANPGSATLGGTLSVPAVNGVATFDTLTLDVGGNDYRLHASASPLVGVTGGPFDVAPTAYQLVFTTQPTGPVNEFASFGAIVQVRDASGTDADVANIPVTISLASNSTGAVLRGTVTVATDVNGVADFTGLLNIDRAGSYTFAVAANGLQSPVPTTTPFVVNSITATNAVFVGAMPVGSTIGATLTTPIVVNVRDGENDPVDGVAVTLILGQNPPGAVLGGTTIVTTSGGAGASFNDLHVNLPGTYRVWALVNGLPPVQSGTFTVTGSPASGALVFTQQPTTQFSGALISPSVTVQVQDLQGNVASTATNSVTLVIGTNVGGATLRGTVTRQAVAGVATFNDLRIMETGTGYTLTAISGGLYQASSSAFDVNPLTFTSQSILVGDAPTGLALGDRDGDTDTDLVTSNLGTSAGADGGYTDLRNAAGVFTVPVGGDVVVAALNDATHVQVGNLDNGGNLDVAVADGSGQNLFLVKDAGGAPLSVSVALGGGLRPTAVRIGDFSGDGIPDLVAASDAAASQFTKVDQTAINVFALTTPGAAAGDNVGIATGLLDAGATLDVVTVSRTSPTLSVVLQTSPGTFGTASSVTLPNGQPARWVELMDVDGDGNLDALVTQVNFGRVDLVVAFGNGLGGFPTVSVVASGLDAPADRLRAAVGDMNGDSIPDLLIPEFNRNQVHIFSGLGGRQFALTQSLSTSSAPVQVVVGNFDASSNLDLAVTCQVADSVLIFRR